MPENWEGGRGYANETEVVRVGQQDLFDFLIYHTFLYDAFTSNLPDLVGFSVSTLHFYKIYHSTEVKHTRKNKKYLRLYAR